MTTFQQRQQATLQRWFFGHNFPPDATEIIAEAAKALDALYLEELLKHKDYVTDQHNIAIEAVPLEAIKELLNGN